MLPPPDQAASYYCNKCGFIGKTDHEPGAACQYMASKNGPWWSEKSMRKAIGEKDMTLAYMAGFGKGRDAGRRELEDEFAALLPGPYYMDPPDGGSVTVLEQFRRMADDAWKYRELTR